MTVRVRFGDLRSVTLAAPIPATAILAEIAEQLVRAVLADYPNERTRSLLVSVSHLGEHADLRLELPLGMSGADLALGRVWRVGWLTVPLTGSTIVSDGMQSGTVSVALELSRSIPDEFRELAEKDV